MASTPHRFDIGPYRKLRLNHKPNNGGYWEIWYTDANDNYLTKKHSTKLKDLVQAEAYFKSFCADRQAETIAAAGPGPRPTVEELCRRWLLAVEKVGKAETGKHVLSAIRREFGPLTADMLDIQAYAGTRGAAPGTIRRELGALRTVLIWAADRKQISRDDIPVFKGVIPASGPPRSRYLDQVQEPWFWAEAQRWGERTNWPAADHLEADAAYRVGLFVAIGLDTAARRGAILDLTWDRVDLVQGLIDFAVPGRRLTNKHRVIVPIAKRLMPVLKEAWLKAPKDALGRAVGPVIGSRHIGRPFARLTRTIGVPWVTPHVMRHTWGSLRAIEGIPLRDIAQSMGDTYATVEAYYIHLTPGHLRRAFKA